MGMKSAALGKYPGSGGGSGGGGGGGGAGAGSEERDANDPAKDSRATVPRL